jgi:hypothetical protein
VQVFFPAVEAPIKTVTAAILSEPSMKRLMDVTQVSDKPQSNTLFIAWCIVRLEHLHILSDSFDDAVAQFAVALLVVCIRVLREVDIVISIHVRYLAARFVRPG